MSTFVLVHGAWHGSWCWKRVRRALKRQGHEVFTPTLTGVGERSHLLSPQVNLETHIQDVVNLIRWEELTDVVLCGHSYGGCVIGGVADRIPGKIASLVYLDAFILKSGECLLDHLPPAVAADMKARAADGYKVPPITAESFRVNAADLEWVNHQCTPQPLGAFEYRLPLTGAAERIKNVTYVLASGWREGSPFPQFFEAAKQKGWKTVEVPCGHDVMLDAPEDLTRILIEAAHGVAASA